MENRGRFRLLIFVCLIILSGLVSVQYYLLRNTFQLNLANYHSQVQSSVSNLYRDAGFQKIHKRYLTNLADGAEMVHAGKLDRIGFERFLMAKDREVSKNLNSLLADRAMEDEVIKGVCYQTGYAAIKIKSQGRTIIDLNIPDQRSRLRKLAREGYQMIFLGQNNGTTDHTGDNTIAIAYDSLIYLEVPAMPFPILKQLVLVGSLSLLLLGAVVIVFFKVIRSAQRQRKITELREDLVNNITHELKTPLSSMAIAFKTLNLPVYAEDSAKQKELIQNLERQHRKLNTTVERVLESSVIREKLNTEQVDIIALLDNYQKTTLSNNHELQVFAGSGSCEVIGSAGLIEAAIDNLVDNAQKYSAAGSLIQISGEKERDMFRIDVIDKGIGIDRVYQEYLFGKFFRVPQHYVHSVQGLGLGLYLSRQSVKSIGGDLQLTNSSPQGSIFSIYLPIA
jgi:signal transduction histidine kinase